MNRALAALLLALLMVPLPAGLAAPDPSLDPSGLLTTDWVGPTGENGWHIRVPVTVEPRINGTSEGLGLINLEEQDLGSWPASVELDLEELLPQAGWLAEPETGNLASFTLDPASVRVVEVTGFSRSDHAIVRNAQADGMDRYAVPHLQFPGLLSSGDAEPFDPHKHPTLSLVFLVDEPSRTHRYHVYLDLLQNGQKTPHEPSAQEQGELDAIWARRHANVFLTPTIATDKPVSNRCLIVTAQFDGTNVRATTGERLLVSRANPEFQGTLRAGERAVVRLGVEDPTQGLVKLAASLPVEVGLVVDNDNRPGSQGLCQGGSLIPLAGNHLLPNGPLNGRRFHVTPLSDTLGVARLAGNPVTVEVRSAQGERLGTFTYDEAASRRRPGAGIPVEAGLPVTVEVTGGRDARVALVSLGDGLQQGVTETGSPAGSIAVAPAFDTGQYVLVSPDGSGHARLEDWTGTLYRGNISLPPGVNPLAGAPVRGFWSLIDAGKPAASEPVLAVARSLAPQKPIQLYSSIENVGDADKSMYTPLQGTGSTEFTAPVRGTSLVVVPHFPTTSVAVTAQTGSGPRSLNRTLTPPGSLTLAEDGGYVVNATKPVATYLHRSSTTSFGGIVPGRPLFLDARPSLPEWGGYLVGLSSTETSVLVPPGQTHSVALDVANMGRRVSGGYLPDRATLEAACVTEDCRWEVSLSTQTLTFPTERDTPQRISIELTPPEGASPEEPPVSIEVTARSVGNEEMSHTLTLGAATRIRYGVLATFDTTSLLPEPRRSQVIEDDVVAAYDVAVVNTGDVQDTIDLRVVEVGGFSTRLLDVDGEPVRRLTLDPGAHAVITLEADPPTDQAGSFLTSFATLAATSQGDSFQLSTVTAITTINPNVELLMRTGETRRASLPGEPVSFEVTIVNLGDTSDVVRVSVSGSTPPGWAPAHVEGLQLEDRVNVAPGRPVQLQVVTQAPEGAPPLAQYSMRVSATPTSSPAGQGEATLDLTAVVDRHFALSVEGINLTLGSPTEALPLDLQLTNRGNQNTTYTLVAGELPDGWQLPPTGSFQLGIAEQRSVKAELLLPARPPAPGTYEPVLRFVPLQEPQRAVDLPLTVEVFPYAGLSLSLENLPNGPLPPGRTHPIQAHIVNLGNGEETLELQGTWPQDRLRVTGLSSSKTLAPGERTTFPLLLQVPVDAASGPLDLNLEARGLTAADRQTLALPIEPLDLAFEQPRLLETARGLVAQAQVVNRGNATAHNLSITLEEQGHPLRNITVAHLPAKARAPVSLIVPAGANDQGLALRLVGGEGLEASPEDNVVPVSLEERPLPLELGWLLLAATVVALALGRRGGGP